MVAICPDSTTPKPYDAKMNGTPAFWALVIIAHGVANVYGGFEVVVVDNILNVFGFGLALGSKTLVAHKVMPEAGESNKGFDIIALAVAYNKQLVFFGQVLQRFFQLRI